MESSYIQKEKELETLFLNREGDWRNGALVYQVMVDRFVPSLDLEKKKALYIAPRKLKKWNELPARGVLLKEYGYWSHELEFWGGDLQSLTTKLDYIKKLGVDILYLNPIHEAYSNHKYDAINFFNISPEYGTMKDLNALADSLHSQGMKLVLDGVLNHMGVNSPLYKEASKNELSEYRKFFVFGSQFPHGVRLWQNALSLPELDWTNPAVRNYIYKGKDSVVRTYLKNGVDGWRLDTAFEFGFTYLHELTLSAHEEKPGSLVIGEINNYPSQWFPAVDGLLNFTLRDIIIELVNERINPLSASIMINRLVKECGIDSLLKSWLLLENHDTPRIVDTVISKDDLHLAQALQFFLPGTVNLYYGGEVGMEGAGDPANRAAMRWDLVNDNNVTLQWTKTLIKIRKSLRAIRIGEYIPVDSQKLLAFERRTDKVGETVIVVVNPSKNEVEEEILITNSKLMGYTRLINAFDGLVYTNLHGSFLKLKMSPKSIVVLTPDIRDRTGYTMYKNIK